jgi:RNA polymerase sigma factor (sigma-70 family)
VEEIQSLVSRARTGDLTAYGQIVRAFQDMAYGYAYAVLGDSHLAQDAAQEAFLQTYRELAKLRDPGAFPGWFRRIVFKCCDRLIRGKRVPTVPFDPAAPLRSDQLEPSEEAEKREAAESVLAAVRALPDDQRTVTTLYYINGYSQREVAEFLGVPVTTVNDRLHASRRRLKERMVAMVKDQLRDSKPGPDFGEKVREAIGLQREERFREAVSAHRLAVKAAGKEEASPQEVYDSYVDLFDSYMGSQRLEDYADGILEVAMKSGGEWSREINYAAHMLVDAGKPERALALLPRMQRLAEELEGSPRHRWYLIEIATVELEVAMARGDEGDVDKHRERILDALNTFEEEVRRRYPALSSARGTEDVEAKSWFTWLGHAYHNAAVRAFHHCLEDAPTALRLMRRASELRDTDPTEFIIARFTLSVERDREEALSRLRQAFEMAENDPQKDFFRAEFFRQPEFGSVRDDPEFLAVIGA